MCTQDDCSFVAQFFFLQTFVPPINFVLHSCQVLESLKESRRYATAKQIAVNHTVRDIFMTFGSKVAPGDDPNEVKE